MSYMSHGKIFLLWYIISKQNIKQKRQIKENVLTRTWLLARIDLCNDLNLHNTFAWILRIGKFCLLHEEDVDKTYF